MAKNGNGNGQRLTTQQAVNSKIKTICDILRRSNCAGAMQYVPELTWILFLRILDEREESEAEYADAVSRDFTPSLAYPYRWQDWAAPDGDKRAELQEGTINSFIDFVNDDLLPYLRGLRDDEYATPRQVVIGEMMSSVERTRVDTERNFLDVLYKVNEISEANIDNRRGSVCSRVLH
jgi:type I restriction enzyme M protein